MADTLQQWINDASAYELLNTYRIEQQVLYPFVNNGEDFYISLLNRLFFTLRDDKINPDEKKGRLLQIVKGLVVFSEETTADNFEGVNRHNNLLYIAAIYYLCEYNALSSLFMWRAKDYNYENESAQLLYGIMAGSLKYARTDNQCCQRLKHFMDTGDEGDLDAIDERLSQKIKDNDYVSLDDFFDTFVSVSVMRSFRESNLWKVLMPFGGSRLWSEYIGYAVKQHIFALLPSQEDAISKGLLSCPRSFSLKMPTSAGKTFLTELLVYQEIKSNPNAKILYLAPLRSLSRELKERYGRLSHVFDFDFRAAYGGCTTSVEEETIENAKLLIATPETFTTLEGTIEHLIEGYTLVICDEGQLLEDKTRGVSYELLLTRLKRNANTRFLFISAIIPNIAAINQWLGGAKEEVGDSKYRPCKIRFALAYENNKHVVVQYANDSINKWSVKVDDFMNDVQSKLVGTSQKSLSCAVALKAVEAGPVMLYCSTKDWHRGCIAHAEEVLKILTKTAFRKPAIFSQNVEWLEKVAEYCSYQLGNDYRLTECVRAGFAYHHGQMPQDIRELIEISIAKKAIQLVVCTKTLSEGINMPIKTAVLANIQNPADENHNSSLELRDLKNIVGRVGRAGKETYGLVILPIKGKNQEPFNKVVSVLQDEGEVEEAKGSLFYIVQEILIKNLTTDDEINAFLESEGVAEAIDTLINLNKDDTELDEINLDDVLEDSLAHYLGNDETRQVVKRVFNIRYAYLQNTLSRDEYGKYLLIGLPLTDYKELMALLENKTAEDFDVSSPVEGGWIHFMIETVYRLSSIKRAVSFVTKAKPLYSIHQNLGVVERIVAEWLSGKQYVEIAASVGCSTEQAALYVDFIQKSIAVKAQSIVSYITETFNLESQIITLWPEMLKRGVCDEKALWLIDSGLGDRTVVNILAAYFNGNFAFEDDKEMLLDEVLHGVAAGNHVMSSNIPVLSKENWKQYLRLNGVM